MGTTTTAPLRSPEAMSTFSQGLAPDAYYPVDGKPIITTSVVYSEDRSSNAAADQAGGATSSSSHWSSVTGSNAWALISQRVWLLAVRRW